MNNAYQVNNNDLQEILHTEIPLTQAMGIFVRCYSGNSITLSAPLQPNINHKNTAFGGSLYNISVLAGWGLLYIKLMERGISGTIVIQKSSIDYMLPVEQDFSATCTIGDVPLFERFVHALQRKGRARMRLNVSVAVNNCPAVAFSGTYVVFT